MDEFAKQTLAWVKNKGLERTENYVRRGRVHKILSEEALAQRWIESFRAFVANPHDEAAARAHHGYDAEFAVRDKPPPYDKVAAEFDVLKSKANAALAERQKDPAAFEADGKALTEEIIEFAVCNIEAPKN